MGCLGCVRLRWLIAMMFEGAVLRKMALLTLLAAILLLALAGCVAAEPAEESCPEGFERYVEFQLFFGLHDGAGNRVSEAEWEAFLADTVTPRFPAGMTIIDVNGQWQEPSGNIQREETKLLMGLLDATDGEGLRLINEISDEFVRRFDQDPVFRMVNEVCAGIR